MVRELAAKIFRLSDREGDVVKDESVSQEIKYIVEGSPGTEIYSGYIQEEYLQTLHGSNRAKKYDEMRRSDPQITMLLAAVKNSIMSASFEIEPGDETPEAKEDAELIEQILFKDIDFDQFKEEAYTVVEFGHSIFDVTHKLVLNHEKFGSYHSLQSLAWRSPKTIERFNVDPQGKLLSVTQYAYGDAGKTSDMDAKFLLVFTLKREGANYEGISMLRPCYGNWFRKNIYLKLNAIGIEKSAVPTPIGKHPAGIESGPDYKNFVNVLRAYTSHQKQFITVPEGYSIDLKSNDFDPSKVELCIDNEDKRMSKAFMANFLELGMGTTGSYSLSNDLSDFFLGGLLHIANIPLKGLNRELIPNLIKLNRGPRKAYPKIKVVGIDDKAGKELAETLKMLAEGNFVKPQDGDEKSLRKRYGLPAIIEKKPDGTEDGASDDVAATAMNGAQVSSMVEVVTAYVNKQISRDTAIGILKVGFQLDDAGAEKVLGPENFEPAPPPVEEAPQTLSERISFLRSKKKR